MDILRIVLTVIFVFDCIALAAVVLMQEGTERSGSYFRYGGHLLGKE